MVLTPWTMAGLIRKFETEAVRRGGDEAIGEGSSDQLEDEAAALDKAWRSPRHALSSTRYRFFLLELQPHLQEAPHRAARSPRPSSPSASAAEKASGRARPEASGSSSRASAVLFGELGDHWGRALPQHPRSASTRP
jgi:hypothetical protein